MKEDTKTIIKWLALIAAVILAATMWVTWDSKEEPWVMDYYSN